MHQVNWLPIHSGIAACMIDGLTRRQMCKALGRSNQGIGYRITQMRAMLGVPERNRAALLLALMRKA